MRRIRGVLMIAVVCATFTAPAAWCQAPPRMQGQDAVSWKISPLEALWAWLTQWFPEETSSQRESIPLKCGVSIDPSGACH
jgi:hypothetical protein